MIRSVIVSAVRTPFGRLGGSLAEHRATELGAIAIRAGLERSGVDPVEVGYVVMGQVLQAGLGQAPARQGAFGAGIPIEVPADTINKVCASSIRAIAIADLMIRADQHDVVVTGGMESMSQAPYLLPNARFGYRLGNGELIDHMVFDGLTSTFDGDHMVVQASRVSRELGITRETQDAWAARSQARAAAAQDAGHFAEEIVAVGDVSLDEAIRRETTVETLATLKPIFDPEGTTTAGNAPGVNDGASCVVVCSEAYARSRGLDVLATIVGQASVADDFAYLARTPANAGMLALAQTGRRVADVDRVEINEAFSSVASNSTRMLGVDEGIVNVNGGAVALGHPIGASGGRIVTTLVHELRRSGGGVGLAAICSRAPLAHIKPLGLIRAAFIGLLGALLFSGAAQAFTCPVTPIDRRIAEAEAVFVGRSTGFTPVAGAGIPQRLYRFEVDQEVKGNLGRTVDVRIPVRPANGGQVVAEDVAAGILMNRVGGGWFTTRCGITDPGVVLAEVDQQKGNPIRLAIGVLILGLVLFYSIRRVRRRDPQATLRR